MLGGVEPLTFAILVHHLQDDGDNPTHSACCDGDDSASCPVEVGDDDPSHESHKGNRRQGEDGTVGNLVAVAVTVRHLRLGIA